MLSFLLDIVNLVVILTGDKLSKHWNRKREWTGVVIETSKKWDRLSSKFHYIVVFRKQNGRSKRLPMDEWQASFYKPGWMYTKKKGKDLPDAESGTEYFG